MFHPKEKVVMVAQGLPADAQLESQFGPLRDFSMVNLRSRFLPELFPENREIEIVTASSIGAGYKREGAEAPDVLEGYNVVISRAKNLQG